MALKGVASRRVDRVAMWGTDPVRTGVTPAAADQDGGIPGRRPRTETHWDSSVASLSRNDSTPDTSFPVPVVPAFGLSLPHTTFDPCLPTSPSPASSPDGSATSCSGSRCTSRRRRSSRWTWCCRIGFDQGVQVGTLARGLFPGGVLIDLPHDDPWRVEATRKAIDDGVPAVFEATFIEDRVYVVHRRAGADGRWIHPHRGQVVQQGEGMTTSPTPRSRPGSRGRRGSMCGEWS